MQLGWINKHLGLNKTDDLGRTSYQRHYRLIIHARYFTSVSNETHSDNFMKLARFKSLKYAWSSHQSPHNDYAYIRIDTFTLGKTCKAVETCRVWSWLSSASHSTICTFEVSKRHMVRLVPAGRKLNEGHQLFIMGSERGQQAEEVIVWERARVCCYGLICSKESLFCILSRREIRLQDWKKISINTWLNRPP